MVLVLVRVLVSARVSARVLARVRVRASARAANGSSRASGGRRGGVPLAVGRGAVKALVLRLERRALLRRARALEEKRK